MRALEWRGGCLSPLLLRHRLLAPGACTASRQASSHTQMIQISRQQLVTCHGNAWRKRSSSSSSSRPATVPAKRGRQRPQGHAVCMGSHPARIQTKFIK